jgi:hypothetical protein
VEHLSDQHLLLLLPEWPHWSHGAVLPWCHQGLCKERWSSLQGPPHPSHGSCHSSALTAVCRRPCCGVVNGGLYHACSSPPFGRGLPPMQAAASECLCFFHGLRCLDELLASLFSPGPLW